jgi:hypothetical protein
VVILCATATVVSVVVLWCTGGQCGPTVLQLWPQWWPLLCDCRSLWPLIKPRAMTMLQAWMDYDTLLALLSAKLKAALDKGLPRAEFNKATDYFSGVEGAIASVVTDADAALRRHFAAAGGSEVPARRVNVPAGMVDATELSMPQDRRTAERLGDQSAEDLLQFVCLCISSQPPHVVALSRA